MKLYQFYAMFLTLFSIALSVVPDGNPHMRTGAVVVLIGAVGCACYGLVYDKGKK